MKMDLSQTTSAEHCQVGTVSRAERTLQSFATLAPIYKAMQPAFTRFAALMGQRLNAAELDKLESILKTRYSTALLADNSPELPGFDFFLAEAVSVYCARSVSCNGATANAHDVARQLREKPGFASLAGELQAAFPTVLVAQLNRDNHFYWQ